jgi:hypothetical protein
MATTQTPAMINETMAFWRERTGTPLSPEDARQAIENICGFFQVLQDWAAADVQEYDQDPLHPDHSSDTTDDRDGEIW